MKKVKPGIIINPSLLLFISAFFVRIYYLIWYFIIARKVPFQLYIPTADRRFYDSLATSFLNGYDLNWYNLFSAHYPPFYPLFLAFLYSFFGHNQYSYMGVFLVQIFLSSLCPVLVFWVGKKIFNPFVGFIAAIITIFYFPFIGVSQDLELENLLIFMPLLSIFLISEIDKKTSWSKKVICGLTIGLTLLTKFVFLFILPFFAILWWKLISFKKNFWKNIFIVCFAVFFIFSLWLTRNYLIFKKIFISSQAAQALISINDPKYGKWNRLVTRQFIWEKQNLNEVEKNNFFTQEAFKSFKKHPFLFIKRFIYNWYRLFFQDLNIDFPLPIIVLSINGVVLSFFKKNYKAWITFLFFLLFCTQYALIEAITRYRMPVDWIIILFASYAIYNICKLVIQKLKRRGALLLIQKYLSSFINKQSEKYFSSFWSILTIILFILIFQFFAKIAWVYAFPKAIAQPIIQDCLIEESLTKNNLLPFWHAQEQKNITYQQVYNYQKEHKGEITPFLDKIVLWKGQMSYINRNAVYPLGSAKRPEDNENPEYKGFYDIYYLPSTSYSTFDLVVNRGIKPAYYGDGVVMVNYKGLLDFNFQNSNQVVVVGKIIGQNIFGQIYLEGYGVFK